MARKEQLVSEAMIMKDVQGWKVGESVYSGGRWMPPALSTRPNPMMT